MYVIIFSCKEKKLQFVDFFYDLNLKFMTIPVTNNEIYKILLLLPPQNI